MYSTFLFILLVKQNNISQLIVLAKIVFKSFHQYHTNCYAILFKVARKRLGWVCRGAKYCQIVRDVNKEKRLKFCRDVLAAEDTFDDVVFTDECSIEMDCHARICFRHVDEPPKLKGRPKHPYKVHVWGGISRRGTTGLVIFTGIMDSTFYTEEILRNTLMPFLRTAYPDGHRFQQDNDPKHTSKRARAFMEENEINWWPTPPESPDLNPIENLWHELKHHLRKRVKPRTAEQLEGGIQDFWTGMTPERCCRYIDHLKKVVPKVIECEGRASGY